MDDPSALEDGAAAQFDTGRVDRPRTCPAGAIASGFTPFDPPFLDDPYPFLAQALREEPVFYSPDIDYWVVTRYDDVRDIFQNAAVWSAGITLSAVTPLCIGAGLARLELKVFIEQLERRMPELRIDQPQTFEYPSNLSFRGPARVGVHW